MELAARWNNSTWHWARPGGTPRRDQSVGHGCRRMPVRQTVEGNYKYYSAQDARSIDTDEGKKLVKERIASARKAYQAA
ncbi:MAG: hypothetical protein U0798_05845 [Gemmataceae bacterium]